MRDSDAERLAMRCCLKARLAGRFSNEVPLRAFASNPAVRDGPYAEVLL